MHARDLVDLGAFVAIQAPQFVHDERSFPAGSLEAYWAASRCRFDRWGRFLKDAASALESQKQTRFLWKAIRPGLEEILASELFTRIFAAAAVAHDVYHARQEAGPVMASVMVGQLEARQRTLRLLLLEENPVTTRLNRLRRRVERWTDLCLAHLAPFADLRRWAFYEERVNQFALDMAESKAQEMTTASAVLLASLQTSFAENLVAEAANPDLNEQIAVAILACLAPRLLAGQDFDSTRWLRQVEGQAEQTQAMIDELLRLDELGPLPAPPHSSLSSLPSDGWIGWN